MCLCVSEFSISLYYAQSALTDTDQYADRMSELLQTLKHNTTMCNVMTVIVTNIDVTFDTIILSPNH